MDFVYERKRQGHAPSPLAILTELAQLPHSPAARIAAQQGHHPDDVRAALRDARHASMHATAGRDPDHTAEADRIMSTALDLWRGRGELTLDHILLALLETADPPTLDLLARLGITADRVRAAIPHFGADM